MARFCCTLYIHPSLCLYKSGDKDGVCQRKIGTWDINKLSFVEDTALVADCREKLQNLATDFKRVCERKEIEGECGRAKCLYVVGW